jgi:hypothetical protein
MVTSAPPAADLRGNDFPFADEILYANVRLDSSTLLGYGESVFDTALTVCHVTCLILRSPCVTARV